MVLFLLFVTQGATFEEVTQMTDIFEGSIIRSARRLDEFLNQVFGMSLLKLQSFLVNLGSEYKTVF